MRTSRSVFHHTHARWTACLSTDSTLTCCLRLLFAKETYASWPDTAENKWELADILSVLAMTQPQVVRAAEPVAEEKSADGAESASAAAAATPAAVAPKENGTERESLKFKMLSRAAYLKSAAYKKAQAAAPIAESASASSSSAATEVVGSVGNWSGPLHALTHETELARQHGAITPSLIGVDC